MTVIDPKLPHYETVMRGITKKQLEDDCKTPRKISIRKHFYCKKQKNYKVPGLLVLKFLRPAVIKMAKEKGLPLKILKNFTLSISSSNEDPIYVGEDLLILIQIKATITSNENGEIKKFITTFEVKRKKDQRRVMIAQSDFVNFVLN